MNTTINLCSSYGQDDSLILLISDIKQLPAVIFSEAEREYIGRQVKDEKKIIFINQYKRIIAIHLLAASKDKNALLEKCRKAGDTILASVNRNKIPKIVIVDLTKQGNAVLALAEGIALSNYQFLKFRKEKTKETNSLQNIFIQSRNVNQKQVEHLQYVCEATCVARDLVNEPHSHQTATELSEAFVRLGKESGFKTEVFNKAKIKSLKMGGLLAVNLGSQEPPTFTVMEWKPQNAKNKNPYVLVGKGVVYDTGGLSLKPTPNSMDYMKSDMAGSAAVACAMYAVAKAKLPVHVIALVPATDNRPSENAYVPGDVITMMSGQTVEVLNTDAEGRMLLADALHYAKKYKPALVMDFATLTGAAAAAVGPYGIVCMGTADEKTKNKLKGCGANVCERLAEFPFWEEYDELLKSDIADMKNIGGPIGGAITAGKFLQKFVDYPWMHFDIAGPSFLHIPNSYRGKNATGVGVRLLFEFFGSL
ncbi:MAG: leucyl aminopeptidase [Bacteroidetes bacterium]|nr:leucyl aminopeptidase [Bacteroidota bacterium]